MLRVVVTGASGLIGQSLVAALRSRGDDVLTVGRASGDVRWDPCSGPLPQQAFADRDAVVHLAGESVAQRWSANAREAIEQSRTTGTANLVAGLRASGAARPAILVSASAVGYYGDRGEEPLTEGSAPGSDWLAQVCVGWERSAAAAQELEIRVCSLRTGVVLAKSGGALKRMLPPFRLGIGGPVAGGQQYMPWIALEDVVGMYTAALDSERWSGPVNASAPQPATNAEFSAALGHALHRPALTPVPAFAMRALYGSMAQIVLGGQRALPERALELGYEFRFSALEPALAATLS
ncbi:MAG: TIGR01777 family oxidoreductase [Solirubrobacteraceae bacterium]